MSTGQHGQFATPRARHVAVQFGMWVFLATELMFFGPLFGAYLQGRLMHPAAFAAASRHTDVIAGTSNTLILLTSSLFVALAVEAARRRATARARRWLWTAAALGLAFLAIKAYEYHSEWLAGLVPGRGFSFTAQLAQGAEYFYWLYFAMTGLHAVHLIIGIAMLVWFAIRLRRHAPDSHSNQVEAAGLYWHFVDVIWVFLYPLLYLVDRHA